MTAWDSRATAERISDALHAAYGYSDAVRIERLGDTVAATIYRYDGLPGRAVLFVTNEDGDWLAVAGDETLPGDRPFGVDDATADVVWALSTVAGLVEEVRS